MDYLNDSSNTKELLTNRDYRLGDRLSSYILALEYLLSTVLIQNVQTLTHVIFRFPYLLRYRLPLLGQSQQTYYICYSEMYNREKLDDGIVSNSRVNEDEGRYLSVYIWDIQYIPFLDSFFRCFKSKIANE